MSPFGLLLFAIAATATSQTPSPETQRALDSLSSVAAAVAGPELQPNQALTIGSSGHARAYIELLGIPAAASAAAQLRRTQMMAQVTSVGRQLPVAARAALDHDVAAAFDTAAAHYVTDQTVFALVWYAERLTYDELQAGIYFLSQDLGAKMAHNAAGLTPAEREAIGRYVMDHPEMARVTAANGQFSRDALARREATSARFDAEVKRALCPRLAADHIRLPSCTVDAGS
jgi:hypothetical protein